MLRQSTTRARKHHPKLALDLLHQPFINIAINKCTGDKRAKIAENFRPSPLTRGRVMISK